MADPLFGHRMRDERIQESVVRSWTPALPNPFIGGWQPLAPRKLPPGLLSVDSPPAYLPELLVLDPEDMPAYFRSQKWPFQKTIVSIDNPPPQDDERAAVTGALIQAIWSLPAVPYPQAPKKIAAISTVAGASGAFSSAGVGTDVWVGNSVQNVAPKTFLQAHIIRAWDVPATIQQRRALFPQVTPTTASGAFSSTGAGTDVWTGASLASGALSSAGVGADTWTGSSVPNTAPRLLAQPHIIAAWAPQQLIAQPRRFVPQISVASTTGNFFSLGLGLANWVGAETAAAAFLASGQSSAAFVGRAQAGVTQRFDGWKPARQKVELRHRKDEDEIMRILAAVLPLIQSGTVSQPTHISVPRNARTLH